MKSLRLPHRLLGVCMLGLLFGATLASDSAVAQQAHDAACCLRGTSAVTNYLNLLGEDGDERFFKVSGSTPNLMFLIDTSLSTWDLIQPAYKVAPYDEDTSSPTFGIRSNVGNGCQNPVYDALISAGGFTMSGNYPPIDLGGRFGGDQGFPELFEQSRFYVDDAPSACCDWYIAPKNWGTPTSVATDTAACNLVNASYRPQCITCLQTKGYYLHPERHPSPQTGFPRTGFRDLYSGKFLNFYPPRAHIIRTVLKNVVWNLRNVRTGMSIFNDDRGATVVQRMNPPCNKLSDPTAVDWNNNRTSYLNYINNNLEFMNLSTPLAEALLQTGRYFTTDSSVFDNWFGVGWTTGASYDNLNSNNRSVCFGCQVTSVVVITDGAPEGDNCVPQCIVNQDPDCPGCEVRGIQPSMSGSCPARCRPNYNTAPACIGGTNSCAQDALQKNRMDGVARWFYNNDMQTKNPTSGHPADFSGTQRMITYTVGVGVDLTLLQNTATVGGGMYFSANDRKALEIALLKIVEDVNRRATAFGSSSISSLQTSAGTTTMVPRFIPGKPGEEWKGLLYRFELGNELVNGCEPRAPTDPPHPNDLNADRDCADVFYLDRDGSIVQEDPVSGLFVKRGTSTPARPIWEAGRELTYQSPAYSEPETAAFRNPDTRNIWTVVDDKAPFGVLNSADTMIAFTAANASTLMQYMGIGMDVTNDTVCNNLYTSLGVNPVTNPKTTWGPSCAAAIIEYYRGRNSLDTDPTKRTQTRPWVLADIFHSSPVVVEPPVAEEACSFFRGQCLPSLYTYAGRVDIDARTAWNSFVKTGTWCGGAVPCERRPALLLVGSNGGFLHALESGRPKPLPPGSDRDAFTQRLLYDNGTGRELWAFIPPDLLGALKYSIGKHGYFVDGTPMVRDVWVDSGLNPGRKDPNEFRTVAVVGERGGGNHFFALDVTKNVDAQPRPDFLWMWPQPCDSQAAQVGESWSNFFPKPPPIGPVLLADTSGSGFNFSYRRYNPSTNAWSTLTTQARERWAVLLNGGYDRLLVRGRGFAMVDVWTGQTLWSEFFKETGDAMANRLEYPFVAGAAMLDIGEGEGRSSNFFDGYFDTATLADMGGNLWLARFYEPGQIDPTTGRVTNWTYGRAFQTRKAEGNTMTNRRPITYIPSNALQPSNGYLRAYFGTGDRAALLDYDGGFCSLNNLYTCITMGCSVEVNYKTKNVPSGAIELVSKWKNGQLIEEKATPVACSNCAATCSETEAEVKVKIHECPNAITAGTQPLEREVKIDCDQPAANALNCRWTVDKDDAVPKIFYTNFSGLTRHAFYGLHAYGGGSPTPKVFSNRTQAETFDTARLTDDAITLCPASGAQPAGCLVDLGALGTETGREASNNASGWMMRYSGIDERTASPAGITFASSLESGCVVWNSLAPVSGGSGTCANSGSQQARLIQADYVSGKGGCAEGIPTRFLASTTPVPPPEPTPVTMIPPGSRRITYGLITAQPGSNPQAIRTASETDIVQSVYQLELSQSEHVCRHVTGGDTCAR